MKNKYKPLYVLEAREGNPIESLWCLISYDLDKIKDFIKENKDFYDHDKWWWVILEGQMDKATHWKIHSVRTYKGRKIQNQPVPAKQSLEEAFDSYYKKTYPTIEGEEADSPKNQMHRTLVKGIWEDGIEWSVKNNYKQK